MAALVSLDLNSFHTHREAPPATVIGPKGPGGKLGERPASGPIMVVDSSLFERGIGTR